MPAGIDPDLLEQAMWMNHGGLGQVQIPQPQMLPVQMPQLQQLPPMLPQAFGHGAGTMPAMRQRMMSSVFGPLMQPNYGVPVIPPSYGAPPQQSAGIAGPNRLQGPPIAPATQPARPVMNQGMDPQLMAWRRQQALR